MTQTPLPKKISGNCEYATGDSEMSTSDVCASCVSILNCYATVAAKIAW